MANKNPTAGFKKGDPNINRKGRPPIPADLSHIKPLQADYVKRMITKYWQMDAEDLKAIVSSKQGSVGDLMIASVCAKALIEGDYTRLNFLLDRVIGKVKEVKEIVLPKPTMIESMDGSKQILLGDEKDATLAEVIDD